jgi:hypothetical protein
MISENYGGYLVTATPQGRTWRYDIQPTQPHLRAISILRKEKYFPSAPEALKRARSKIDYTLNIGHTISRLVHLTPGEDFDIAETGEIVFTARGLQRSVDAVNIGKEPVIYQNETLVWAAKP